MPSENALRDFYTDLFVKNIPLTFKSIYDVHNDGWLCDNVSFFLNKVKD